MAQVVWTEAALADLDAIADYIGLDKPEAAKLDVQRIFCRVEQLSADPESGSKSRELKSWRYRQIIEPACRVFYRHAGSRVFILYVMRAERVLRQGVLTKRGVARKN